MTQLLTRLGSLTLLAALAVSCTKVENVTPQAPATGKATSQEALTSAVAATATRDNNLP